MEGTVKENNTGLNQPIRKIKANEMSMQKQFQHFKIIRHLCACTVVLLFTSIQSFAQLYPHEGYVDVTGGKIWYRVVGGGTKTPLLLLHGGPGATSYYLNSMAALSKDRPIIFLDQLGCGRSTRITDTSLMTIANYAGQIAQLKQALGITNYYLYGHSWGTMLGIDYYLQHPEGVKAIIFGSPCFSTDLWIKDADTLIKTLPDSIQQVINTNEQNHTYNSPDYKRVMNIYYDHFLYRNKTRLPEMDSLEKTFGDTVYQYMWGPSEFKATGTLKNYDRLQVLPNIKVPVLLMCGAYDEARPATVKYYQSLIPGAKFVLIKNSGHDTMLDNPEDNNKAIADFLRKVDKE